jgi:threonine/homoserine/homoserine lactone efflux protein
MIGLFAGAALALLVIPGPAVLYIVAQSVERGRVAGLVSMLGIQVGALVHVAAAALGLSALLVQSAVAFSIVKYAGAAYLVYLGLRKLLAREPLQVGAGRPPKALGRLFRQGIVVNVLNPKTALFFFAFLPQFVDPDAGSVGLQIGLLGLLFVAIAIVSDGAYAVAAGTAAQWLRGRRGFMEAERWVSGTVLVGLGVTTALSGQARRN